MQYHPSRAVTLPVRTWGIGIPGVLQMLAKTQRELAGKVGKTPDSTDKKKYLANVKIEDFFVGYQCVLVPPMEEVG